MANVLVLVSLEDCITQDVSQNIIINPSLTLWIASALSLGGEDAVLVILHHGATPGGNNVQAIFTVQFRINNERIVMMRRQNLANYLESAKFTHVTHLSSDCSIIDQIVCLEDQEVNHALRQKTYDTTFTPLALMPRYPLNSQQVTRTIVALEDAVRARREVKFFLDVDATLVIPGKAFEWTFNPAVFELLFTLRERLHSRERYPDQFPQFTFQLLTARVPDAELVKEERNKPYCHTRIILAQFQEILQQLGLSLEGLNNDTAIIALGTYKTDEKTGERKRCSSSKAAYIAEQQALCPKAIIVLVDDCETQHADVERKFDLGNLSRDQVFPIQVDYDCRQDLMTPQVYSPPCPTPLLAPQNSIFPTASTPATDLEANCDNTAYLA